MSAPPAFDNGLTAFYHGVLSAQQLVARSDISILSILLTYRCPAACTHCVVESGPTNKATLDPEVARRFIEAASRQSPPPVVGFTGGEPFVQLATMKELASYASSLGMRSEVVSSSAWARSPGYAREVLADLASRGLRAYCTSVDRYHAPFVAGEKIRNAVLACQEAGIEVRFNTQADPEHHAEGLAWQIRYIAETIGVPEALVEDCPINVLMPTPAGRGKTEVSDYLYESKDFREGCPMATEIITLSPYGFLYPCCGMVLGEKPRDASLFIQDDLTGRSVDEIAEMLSAIKRDLFFRLLQTVGPYQVLRELKRRDPTLPTRDRYVGSCDVCLDFTGNERVAEATRALLLELGGQLAGAAK